MQLVEIRDLDGPNLFFLEPAIKVELKLEDGESDASLAAILTAGGTSLLGSASTLISGLHTENNQPLPRITTRVMDDRDQISIAFTWQRRAFAMAVGQHLVDTLSGVVDDNITAHLQASLSEIRPDDNPNWILDADRSALAISVTGTNGKTSTTRLIAHIMRCAGFRTGWNSSSGIYIEGEEIEEGDYSGPAGARRILEDPSVQVAVLETARGGILLRGLGYEHNDVSVFTNISPDHLDLQGVKTLETLAETKAVVCKVTKPNGAVVANADDPYVMAALADVQAPLTLFARSMDSVAIQQQRDAGGDSIIASRDRITLYHGPDEAAIFPLESIPMTHNGRARHMVENAMAAIGATLGAGLTVAQIREGLRTFKNDPVQNPGRLNVYKCNGVTVVLDFAHNEAGLKYLVDFGKGDLGPDGTSDLDHRHRRRPYR